MQCSEPRGKVSKKPWKKWNNQRGIYKYLHHTIYHSYQKSAPLQIYPVKHMKKNNKSVAVYVIYKQQL